MTNLFLILKQGCPIEAISIVANISGVTLNRKFLIRYFMLRTGINARRKFPPEEASKMAAENEEKRPWRRQQKRLRRRHQKRHHKNPRSKRYRMEAERLVAILVLTLKNYHLLFGHKNKHFGFYQKTDPYYLI